MKTIMMAMLVGGCATAHGQIVNGDFEEPRVPSDTFFLRVFAGEDTIPGWIVTSGSVDLVSRFLISHGEEQWLELNGAGPGEIQQTLQTTAGLRYRVELDYASGIEVEGHRAYLLWNGVIQQRMDGGASVQHLERVIEAQGDDLLTLRGVFQDAAGIRVDKIMITEVPIDTPLTPVPEPSTYGLVASVALLGWAVWRRRPGSLRRALN